MNESLLQLPIEVPLNAVPYHEFLCQLELRWVSTTKGNRDSLNVFSFNMAPFCAITAREFTKFQGNIHDKGIQMLVKKPQLRRLYPLVVLLNSHRIKIL